MCFYICFLSRDIYCSSVCICRIDIHMLFLQSLYGPVMVLCSFRVHIRSLGCFQTQKEFPVLCRVVKNRILIIPYLLHGSIYLYIYIYTYEATPIYMQTPPMLVPYLLDFLYFSQSYRFPIFAS